MSRSYKKNIKVQIACGSNGRFYKLRRRKNRHRLNQELYDATTKYEGEDIDDNINPDTLPKRDLYREPTDGHWGMNLYQMKYQKKPACLLRQFPVY